MKHIAFQYIGLRKSSKHIVTVLQPTGYGPGSSWLVGNFKDINASSVTALWTIYQRILSLV
jgi:hypothetical protein